MKNKKGFTLIELLAVIVILGVLLAVAIPKVSEYITNGKKEGYVDSAKFFLETVKNDVTSEVYEKPVNSGDVTIVTLDKANLQKATSKTAFGGLYLYSKSYVAVINVGTGTYPEYKYFIATQDTKGYAIPLTSEDELSKDKVIANAKNKMEVTIQSICGNDDGSITPYSTISGLDAYKKGTWNATVYSSSECASRE